MYDADLPRKLDDLLEEFTNRGGTPEIPNWPRDPGRPSNYYRVCLVLATLVGRAFALLNHQPNDDANPGQALDRASQLPPEIGIQIHAEYVRSIVQRERLWKVIADVFARALFSQVEPEPGARFAAGVLVLTCGQAIRGWHALDGKGKEWVPWVGHYEKRDARWRWSDVERETMATAQLPRGNTNGGDCWRRISHPEEGLGYRDDHLSYRHVGQEVLDVFDAARVHLTEAEDDWTSTEVMGQFLVGLDEAQNETNPGPEDSANMAGRTNRAP